jgi:host factor-I protein
MNRKLIRPNFSDYKEKMSREASKKKAHPGYDTHAENYYYLKQMNKKIPMAVIFDDGDRVEGYVEWYDRDCIKLNRNNAPNLLIYKHAIKYLFKLEEKGEKPETPPTKPPKKRSTRTQK